ncbi:hypothetical protein ACXZ9C_11755 [Streptococcus agalactiae]
MASQSRRRWSSRSSRSWRRRALVQSLASVASALVASWRGAWLRW